MGQAIGNILPLAIGVAISPVAIIAIVVMLGTPRARSNGLAFAAGWVAGLTIVGAITLAIATGNATQDSGEPATWTSIVKLLFGVLFLLLAGHTWRGRPKPGHEAEMPKWVQAVDGLTAGKSFGFGAILSGVKPKNLALTVAAAASIAEAGLSNGQEAGVLAVFVVVGSLSILTPLVIYFAMGSRATGILDGLKTSMVEHNGAIITVLLLVLGAKLTGDAISALTS